MVEELKAGRVTSGIMLTHSYTDTGWFHQAAAAASAICFTRGRISFISQQREEVAAPLQGQAFFYFGDHVDRFREVFRGVGLVMRP
jgi:hypothetical protein